MNAEFFRARNIEMFFSCTRDLSCTQNKIKGNNNKSAQDREEQEVKLRSRLSRKGLQEAIKEKAKHAESKQHLTFSILKAQRNHRINSLRSHTTAVQLESPIK
jgi:hypothetical protein